MLLSPIFDIIKYAYNRRDKLLEKERNYNNIMARVGKKTKTKFKLCKELVLLIVVLVAMITTTIVLNIPSESKSTYEEINSAITAYNSANSTSYSTIGEDHVFKNASYTDVTKEINQSQSGTDENVKYVYVLYGTLDSATVLEFLSYINTEAQQREKKKVLFYSSSTVDNQEDKDDADFISDIEKKQEELNKSLGDLVDPIDLLKTPAFYVYKNGSLVFNSTTMDDDASYNWYLMIRKAFSL